MREDMSSPASVLLDSRDYPAEAFPAWREAVARNILGLDFHRFGDQPFRALMEATFAGDVILSRTLLSPASTVRDKELSSKNGDYLVLAMARRGAFISSQFGQDLTLAPGEATLMSCDDIGSMTCPQGGSYLTVLLPRRLFAGENGALNAQLMKRIDARSSRLRLAMSYARLVSEKGTQLDAVTREAMGRHLAEMILLAATDPAIDERRLGTLAHGQFETLRAMVAQAAGDPAIALAGIAARAGLSPRQVQYVFEQAGTSFTALLLEERLMLAQRLLVDPAHRHRRIADIAISAGFGDLSFFNRRFRQCFGQTPSDMREQSPPNETGRSKDFGS